jgi:hypothetical protein
MEWKKSEIWKKMGERGWEQQEIRELYFYVFVVRGQEGPAHKRRRSDSRRWRHFVKAYLPRYNYVKCSKHATQLPMAIESC